MIGFVQWWLFYQPSRIYYVSVKIIVLVYNYFSIPLLLKTLLDPWKKDEIDTTNMSLDDIIKVWFMNLVSRLVGGVVRGMTVLIGVIIIVLTFFGAIIYFIGFMLMPLIVAYLVINSLGRLA